MPTERVPYTSPELFHFVGYRHPNDHEANYRTLKTVLLSQCVSHPPHDGSWGSTSYERREEGRLEDESLLVPTVTCYCDIPKAALALHTSKYGAFGVGFPRSFAVQFGARPVTYIPMQKGDHLSLFGRQLVRSLELTHKSFKAHVLDQLTDKPNSWHPTEKATSPAEAIARMDAVFEKDVLAFIKPFDSDLADDNVRNFYMEREWRKFGNLRFSDGNVSSVAVASGWEDRLKSDMPAYAARVFTVSA
jgi:hypothetical protein